MFSYCNICIKFTKQKRKSIQRTAQTHGNDKMQLNKLEYVRIKALPSKDNITCGKLYLPLAI